LIGEGNLGRLLLELLGRARKGMLVFVKFLSGKTVAVDGLDRNDTVRDLKQRVGEREGVPVERLSVSEKKKKKNKDSSRGRLLNTRLNFFFLGRLRWESS